MAVTPARSSARQLHATQAVGVFAHPVTLLCIAGWLINDHVLKQAYGNAVTGKLSDIFGLAVFPLIVAALLPNRVPHRIRWALIATAVFFTAINVVPAASRATVVLLDTFTPTNMLWPDPTDLITLPALAIAHHVWTHPVNVTKPMQRRIGRLAFSAALLTTMATSEHAPFQEAAVIRVEATEDGFFALAATQNEYWTDNAVADDSSVDVLVPESGTVDLVAPQFGPTLRDMTDQRIYRSNNGFEWTRINQARVDWKQDLLFCVDDQCFEIEPRDQAIQEHTQGLQEAVVFEATEPNQACIDSSWSVLKGRVCDKQITTGAYDAAVSPDERVGVVAMGSEGVAVRFGGEWTRVGIDGLEPRSYIARNRSMIIWLAVFGVLFALASRSLFYVPWKKASASAASSESLDFNAARSASPSDETNEHKNGETPDP